MHTIPLIPAICVEEAIFHSTLRAGLALVRSR